MLINNDEIYYIFRNDLHLSEEKTRILLLSLDSAIEEVQAKNFVTRTEVSALTFKLGEVVPSEPSMNEDIKEIKADLKEIKENLEEIVFTISIRVALYIIAATIVALLMHFLKL